MPLILWTDEYSVGIDALDADHIIIISLMNHIEDAKQVSAEEAVVGRLVKVLLDYAYHHFRREEELLEAHRYPQLERHREEHHVLEEQLGELHAAYTRNPDPEISQEILELLNFWFLQHILKVDMHYKQFLQQAMA